jgi:plasmid stability protein
MATITIRNLDNRVHERLREQAKLHQRSLEAEARAVLDRALRIDRSARVREAEAIRRSLEGRYTGASTAEIRAAHDNGYEEGPSCPSGVDSKSAGEASGGDALA